MAAAHVPHLVQAVVSQVSTAVAQVSATRRVVLGNGLWVHPVQSACWFIGLRLGLRRGLSRDNEIILKVL